MLAGQKSRSQEPSLDVFSLKDSLIYYERIVTRDSATKHDLYLLSKTWITKNFTNTKSGSTIDDASAGLLSYTSSIRVPFDAPKVMGTKVEVFWEYNFTMTIYIKDSKTKIVIDNLRHTASSDPNYLLHFRAINKKYLNNKMFGKGYEEKYMESARKNFQSTNEEILLLLDSFTKFISYTKNGFDF